MFSVKIKSQNNILIFMSATPWKCLEIAIYMCLMALKYRKLGFCVFGLRLSLKVHNS